MPSSLNVMVLKRMVNKQKGQEVNSASVSLMLDIPYAPCMVYLPTFGCLLGQMLVNIPYMEHMDMAMVLWNRMECTSRWLALQAGDGRGARLKPMKKTWWTEV